MLTLVKEKYLLQGKNYKGLYKCDCGVEIIAFNNNVKRGLSTCCMSCRNKNISTRMQGNSFGTKHGRSYSREYNSWVSMIQRCTNPNNDRWEHYGGRGITVDNLWLDSFENFYKDMGVRPTKTSLDRINNNLGYFKDNCRWATASVQNMNRGY